ncbi:MAG TPA: histidine kinase, partial [Anaeromyxobacteraceae bacterium]|nr:histidine kinase [Anaeromyxobacteraceae bacterium]
MTERRATPDDLPEPPERRRRGRLKVYLGYAAGVGKTWRMLEEAHALRAAGVDVVGALVEPHGRPEVAARVGDLELVPRRRVEHRGVAAEELDLEAALRRRPAVALVDELQHVNAPGSRNARRHQDVEDLLAAGVDVIGAVNVQHLESLNDLVERATGLRVREAVPDAFLEQADELVDLDLAVEDLQARLRAGAIYPPDRVAWAEAHLFAARSLATLRELALREVAESLERTA